MELLRNFPAVVAFVLVSKRAGRHEGLLLIRVVSIRKKLDRWAGVGLN